MAIVMGLDQSITCTGVCIMDGTKVLYTGVVQTKKTKRPQMEDLFYRCRMIAAELNELISHYRVQTVIMEGLSFGSRGNATRDLSVLMGTIVAGLRGFPLIVAPTTLKKYATGDGRADKEAMHVAISGYDVELYEKLLNVPKTKGRYDIADAYWLAKYYKEF